jgi:peptidoglycan hydrolase-like protein with peptidoglycan-binding domain
MSPMWWVRVIRMNDCGEDVRAVQQICGLPQSGLYDYDTALTVRGAQLLLGLPATGEVDEETAIQFGPRSDDQIPPDWYKDEPLYPGTLEYGLVVGSIGGEDAVRRVQGQYGLTPTGVIDQQTALILGAIGVDHAVY